MYDLIAWLGLSAACYVLLSPFLFAGWCWRRYRRRQPYTRRERRWLREYEARR